MNISELIDILTKIEREHGNLELSCEARDPYSAYDIATGFIEKSETNVEVIMENNRKMVLINP